MAAAASWCQTLECTGGTNLLQAMRVALADDVIDGIYVISDGMPDESTKHVLREVAAGSAGRKVHVRTVLKLFCSTVFILIRTIADQHDLVQL